MGPFLLYKGDFDMVFRFLMAASVLIFTVEHPYFVALSCILYLFNQFMTTKEKEMLKDLASKGSVWLVNLNAYSRSKGFTMKKGREIASDLLTNVLDSLSKEQVQEFLDNDRLRDKVNRVILTELQEEELETTWFNEPLSEGDQLDKDEKDFIKYFAPDFNWDENYNQKDHRQLFKTIKSKFRNPDGSIKDKLGNECTLVLERWIYAMCSDTECEGYKYSEQATSYLANKEYK